MTPERSGQEDLTQTPAVIYLCACFQHTRLHTVGRTRPLTHGPPTDATIGLATKNNKKLTTAGLEPATVGLEVQRAIHCATQPMEGVRAACVLCHFVLCLDTSLCPPVISHPGQCPDLLGIYLVWDLHICQAQTCGEATSYEDCRVAIDCVVCEKSKHIHPHLPLWLVCVSRVHTILDF